MSYTSWYSGKSTKDLGREVMKIAAPYIKQGIVGFRPPAAYYRAIDNNEVILHADSDNGLLGFLHFHWNTRLKKTRIYAIVVREDKRRMNIGTLLLDNLHEITKVPIYTEISPKNEASTTFFTKHGYKQTGVKKHKKYETLVFERNG